VAKTPKSKKIYRERTPIKFALKLIGVILLALIILAIVIFFSFRQYLVYDSDGVHLDVPFLRFLYDEEETDIPDVEVIVESGVPVSDDTDSSTPAATEPISGHLVTASKLSSLDGETLISELEAAGEDTLVFELKPSSGQLAYQSDLEEAADYDLSGDVEIAEIEELITLLNEAGIHTVAAISCFADTTLATRNTTAALLSEDGTAYVDENGNRWLDSANTYAQEYIKGLCRELAEMGFDEILLQNFRSGTENDTAVLQVFTSDLIAVLHVSGTDLSLEVASDDFEETLADMALAGRFTRFYIPLSGESEAFLSQAETILGTKSTDQLILMSKTRLSENIGWIKTAS